MTQPQALRVAAWTYLILGALFMLLLVAGPSTMGRALSTGQVVSLVMFTAVSITLGLWSWRIGRGRAPLSSAFFGASFSAGPVVGVAFGGMTYALIFGIPFLFVAIAWRKAVKARASDANNDR